MGRYGRINSSLWKSSRKWRGIRSNRDARLLYFYLHTNHHANSVLTYFLPLAYIANDNGFSMEESRKAIDSLSEAGLIWYSWEESVVHVVGAVLQDEPTNKKHAKGMLKALFEVDDCEAKCLCAKELAQCDQVQAVLEDPATGIVYREPFESLLKAYRTPSPSPTPVLSVSTESTYQTERESPPQPSEHIDTPASEAKSQPQVTHSRDPVDDFVPDPAFKANELRELWEGLDLPTRKSVATYKQEIKLRQLHTEPPHWSTADVEQAMQKLAADRAGPGDLEWVWSKGPQYLAERSKDIQVIEHVLIWKPLRAGGAHEGKSPNSTDPAIARALAATGRLKGNGHSDDPPAK